MQKYLDALDDTDVVRTVVWVAGVVGAEQLVQLAGRIFGAVGNVDVFQQPFAKHAHSGNFKMFSKSGTVFVGGVVKMLRHTSQ